jgi:hypothetical protein
MQSVPITTNVMSSNLAQAIQHYVINFGRSVVSSTNKTDPHDIAYMSVLVMAAAAPHVHRQYGHVRPWRKSLGGVSLSPRGIRRICKFAGKRTGNVSPPFRQRQRTAILLLFVSNPTRRYRHLRTVLPVLLQTETSRNEDKILRSNC